MKGDVVVLPSPYSDLTGMKRRPAVVIATPKGPDILLCQVTRVTRHDEYTVSLNNHDMQQGILERPSTIRPNRIFAADKDVILYRIGSLTDAKAQEVQNAIVRIVTA